MAPRRLDYHFPMNTVLKALAAVLAVAVAGALIYIYGFLPRQRPAPDLRVEATPAVLEHGEYLVKHVLLCNDCHSERDWTLYSGPAKPPLGAGRPCMDKDTKAVGINFGMAGFPGRLCIRNITPDVESGIGGWTDGEIARAIREGVSRDGEALFPIMPWFMYTGMSDEDVGGRDRVPALPAAGEVVPSRPAARLPAEHHLPLLPEAAVRTRGVDPAQRHRRLRPVPHQDRPLRVLPHGAHPRPAGARCRTGSSPAACPS